jgi:hypothetical protein
VATRRGAGPVRGALAILLAGILLAACTGGSGLPIPPSPKTTVVSTVPLPPTGSAVPRTTLVTADLHVSSGFSAVQIVAGDIGPDLVRASGPADAISAPVVTLTGTMVTITQPQGGPQISVLSVQLAQPVSWQVDLDGGASTAGLDLHTTRVRGVDLTAGVSSLTIALPAPSGTVPLNFSAGASHVVLRVARSAPARLTMAGGAGTLTVYGQTRTGIAGGTIVESPTWPSAQDRLDVICSAGISALTVEGV